MNVISCGGDNGNFQLIGNSNLQNVQIEIFNLLGEKIYNQIIKAFNLNTKYSIPLNEASGIYILTISRCIT